MAKTPASSSTVTTRMSLLIRLNAAEPQPRELAWEEFVRRYSPIIRGFARKLGCAAGDVDEIAQEVVVGFYAASPTFQYDPAKGRFRGYLKTCTMHAIQKHRRKSGRHAGAPIDEIDVADPRHDQTWNDLFEKQLLRQAINDTRDRYKNNTTFQAWKLVVIDQVPSEKAAEQLGMSLDNVYKAKQRISTAVKDRLIELGGGEH